MWCISLREARSRDVTSWLVRSGLLIILFHVAWVLFGFIAGPSPISKSSGVLLGLLSFVGPHVG